MLTQVRFHNQDQVAGEKFLARNHPVGHTPSLAFPQPFSQRCHNWLCHSHFLGLIFRHSFSQLCHNGLRHWGGVRSLSPSCLPTLPEPSKSCGYITTNKIVKATQRRTTHVNRRRIKKRKSVPSQFKRFWFYLCRSGYVVGCKRNAWSNLSCLLQTHCHLSTNE